MKTNIATNQEQATRLLRCGVSADTADMIYQTPITASQKATREDILLVRKADKTLFDTDIPAWSLNRLLGLLPKEMGIAIGAYPGSNKYTCFTLIDPDIEPIVADTAIESTVQMIEQLTNNGYKLNER